MSDVPLNEDFDCSAVQRGSFCQSNEVAGCHIFEAEWPPPPTPPSCGLDYGRALKVFGDDRGEFSCYGGLIAPPASPALSYGRQLTRGAFRCASSLDGITCENTQTGHGFSVSRQEATVF